MSRYTSNREGAFVGWKSDFNQVESGKLPQRTSIKGLYVAGHWVRSGYLPQGGIPSVTFSGRRVASLILKDIGMKWEYKEISP